MKRLLILLLAVSILCFCLSGCVETPAESQVPATDPADMTQVTEQETNEPETTAPEATETVEPETEIPGTLPHEVIGTVPDYEMPTRPGADYELPPGEKPGGEVVTE